METCLSLPKMSPLSSTRISLLKGMFSAPFQKQILSEEVETKLEVDGGDFCSLGELRCLGEIPSGGHIVYAPFSG